MRLLEKGQSGLYFSGCRHIANPSWDHLRACLPSVETQNQEDSQQIIIEGESLGFRRAQYVSVCSEEFERGVGCWKARGSYHRTGSFAARTPGQRIPTATLSCAGLENALRIGRTSRTTTPSNSCPPRKRHKESELDRSPHRNRASVDWHSSESRVCLGL